MIKSELVQKIAEHYPELYLRDAENVVNAILDEITTALQSLGLEPIARLVSCAVAGVEPLYMGIGPCAAIPKALKQANMKLDDIQAIELNEAFGAQALAVIQEAGLNPDIVNVNGGAIALGHPLGCTGAKLTVQIINEMRRSNQRYGMVTACVGGGQGIAGIIERLS